MPAAANKRLARLCQFNSLAPTQCTAWTDNDGAAPALAVSFRRQSGCTYLQQRTAGRNKTKAAEGKRPKQGTSTVSWPRALG